MRASGISFYNILFNRKSHEKTAIYEISYKNFIGAKPFCIWAEKIDGFIKIYNGTRDLILSGSEQYDAIYNRIIYLIIEKSGITDSIIHSFARIRMN